MHETELYNGSFYPRQPVDQLEEEDELTTKREADIQNKISYIKGALEKLRSNFPAFNPVKLMQLLIHYRLSLKANLWTANTLKTTE